MIGIGTHKRVGHCYHAVYCATCVLSCCFLRTFPLLWCGFLSQHFLPSQHFTACVHFISRAVELYRHRTSGNTCMTPRTQDAKEYIYIYIFLIAYNTVGAHFRRRIKSVPLFQVGPPGHFTNVSITTPVVSR